ncbi:MAG: hypothetical protein RBJ76_15435 [Stenomitos frigidus ULC029]
MTLMRVDLPFDLAVGLPMLQCNVWCQSTDVNLQGVHLQGVYLERG